MTVTEASRDVVEGTGGPGAGRQAGAPSLPVPAAGLANLVGSGDPRTIGKLFAGTSLLFLLVAAGAGLAVGFDRVDTSDAYLGEAANQVQALYAITGLFLVVLPLMIGLATAIVPLQIGASTVAFPRASAAAYWTYLTAGGLCSPPSPSTAGRSATAPSRCSCSSPGSSPCSSP